MNKTSFAEIITCVAMLAAVLYGIASGVFVRLIVWAGNTF